LRRYWRSRLVMSRCGLNSYQDSAPLYRVIERHFLHRILATGIGNSSAAVEELAAEGIPHRKLRVIHNGIDVAAWRARMPSKAEARAKLCVPDNALVISNVGNLWPYKGYADLLKAIAQHSNKLPPWQLLIAGRDQDGRMGHLMAMAVDMGIANNVRFLGPTDDIPGLLAAADMHVSASHTESLPNNILEAMAAGLPIVATTAGGTAELVEPRQDGYLVAVGDTAQLGRTILTLAHAPRQREAFGAASLTRSQAFSIDRNVAMHASVYRNDAVFNGEGRAARMS
jgi:glycosyltransferase involved in cell wall biosynthesis